MGNNLSIKNDLKSSFILAKRNLLSFFLAMIGLVILLLIAIVAVSIPLAMAIGFTIGSTSRAKVNVSNPAVWVIAGLGILLNILIFTFAMMVLGGIFGMSKEIVENGKSQAEKPFRTLKEYFLSLFLASLIIVLIIEALPLVMGGINAWAYGGDAPLIVDWIEGIAFLAWVVFTIGFTIMILPGIVDGKSVKEALLESINKAKNNPARIYSMVGIYIGIYVGAFLPIILWAILSGSGNAIWIAIYAPIMIIILVFIVTPAMILTFSRIYNDLEGGTLAEL